MSKHQSSPKLQDRKFRIPYKSVGQALVLLAFLAFLLGPVNSSPVLAAEALWSAYNDLAGVSGSGTTSYSYTGSTTGPLLNYDTQEIIGGATPVTVTITYNENVTTNLNAGGYSNAGTDAHNTFYGKADMKGAVVNAFIPGWYVAMTFTNLDPAKTYTFATTANGANTTHAGRVSQFQISDIAAAVNNSTYGVDVIDNETVAFDTGYNTVNGYVARWTGIQPGADGDFTVQVSAYPFDSGYYGYGPSVFLLEEEDALTPSVTTYSSLAQFFSTPGVPSDPQIYTVAGSALTDSINITAPAGFQLSTDGSVYSPSLTLAPSSGSLEPTNIYVRLNGSSTGIYSGDITHSSADATTKSLTVRGIAASAVTTTFQNGTSNYSGMDDTFIRGTSDANVNFGNETVLQWQDDPANTNDEVTLMRFYRLFVSENGPIPDEAIILSASLTYWVTDQAEPTADGSPAFIYDIAVDWDGTTVTWNNFGGDPSIQPDEINLDPIGIAPANVRDTPYTVDVTTSLKRWINGAPNYGWLLLPTSFDTAYIHSSEAPTAAYRPQLAVTYIASTNNTAPVITQGASVTVEMSEDGTPDPFALTLDATDVDAGDILTWSILSPASSGTATAAGTGPSVEVSYTPNANFNGADSFVVQVTDLLGATDTILVNVSIEPVNDAPLANAQTVTVIEDTPQAITLTGTDVDGDALTFAVVSGPSHGILSGTAPNLTYTPASEYSGPDSFTFTVNDGTVTSAPATVSITVTAVNDPPVANNQSVTTNEDVPVAITLTGSDPENSALTFAVASSPNNGSLSGDAPNLTYTPNSNYNGPDSFTFTVSDGLLTSTAATVSITVTAVNDPPVATAQSVTTDEDVPVAITLAGTDVDGDSLTFALASNPSHGSLSGTAPNLTYNPAANYNGPDSFTFTVNDGTVTSAAATVSITVTAVNDAPVCLAVSLTTAEDTLGETAPNCTDVDGDELTYSIVAQPASGVASVAGGSLRYMPDDDFNGADSFTYRAFDGVVYSNTVQVTVNVTEANDAPVIAEGDSVTVTMSEDGAPTAFNLTLNATDPEGQVLTWSIATQATHGTATAAGTGESVVVGYTPTADYHGADSFVVAVMDSSGGTDSITVNVTITAVNDAPVAVDDQYTTKQNETLTVTAAAGVLSNDTDVDGDPLSAVLVDGPAEGVLVFNADGSFSYTPAANFTGTVTFTYRANDGEENSQIAEVRIVVENVDFKMFLPLILR